MKQDWEIKKLGEVCTIKGRIGFRGYTRDDLVEQGDGAITLSPSNIHNDTLTFDKCQYISWFKYEESPEIQIYDGDIIYAKTASIGKVALVKNLPEKATINPQFVVFKEIKCYAPYLYYSVRGEGFKHQISLITNGVAIPTVSQTNMAELTIPVPPREEQERIVEELDCLSGVIERKREQLRELDALAQSIFYQMFGDPITNEKGWGIDRLGNMCEISSSKRIYAHEYCEDGIPFYRGKEITEKSKGNDISVELYIAEDRYNELKRKFGVPQIGDILITAVGTIGNLWVVDSDTPFYFKDGNVLWLQVKDNINPIYFKTLLYNLIDKYKESMANGCAYSALTIVNLKEMQTNKIPFALQQEFADKIEAIEKQKELIKKSISETETLFNARMDYYFN